MHSMKFCCVGAGGSYVTIVDVFGQNREFGRASDNLGGAFGR